MTEVQQARSRICRALVISGVITIIVAVVLGATVEPFLYAIAAVGLFDFFLAALFSRGKIPLSTPRADPAARAEADPSYNPYARED